MILNVHSKSTISLWKICIQRKSILHSVLQINCWTCTRASWGFSQAIFHARWVSWFNVRETGDLGETRELFAQQSAYEKHQVAIQICFFPLKSDMGPTKQSSLASLFSQQSYSPTYFETLWKHGATKIESTNQQPRDPRGDSLWSQPALEPCMGSASLTLTPQSFPFAAPIFRTMLSWEVGEQKLDTAVEGSSHWMQLVL